MVLRGGVQVGMVCVMNVAWSAVVVDDAGWMIEGGILEIGGEWQASGK